MWIDKKKARSGLCERALEQRFFESFENPAYRTQSFDSTISIESLSDKEAFYVPCRLLIWGQTTHVYEPEFIISEE